MPCWCICTTIKPKIAAGSESNGSWRQSVSRQCSRFQATGPGERFARDVLRFPVWARRAAYAAAAVVLVAAGVLVLTYNPAPAMASLNDILSWLGKPGDRTYHITMEDLPEPPGRPPPDEGPRMTARGRTRAPGTGRRDAMSARRQTIPAGTAGPQRRDDLRRLRQQAKLANHSRRFWRKRKKVSAPVESPYRR